MTVPRRGVVTDRGLARHGTYPAREKYAARTGAGALSTLRPLRRQRRREERPAPRPMEFHASPARGIYRRGQKGDRKSHRPSRRNRVHTPPTRQPALVVTYTRWQAGEPWQPATTELRSSLGPLLIVEANTIRNRPTRVFWVRNNAGRALPTEAVDDHHGRPTTVVCLLEYARARGRTHRDGGVIAPDDDDRDGSRFRLRHLGPTLRRAPNTMARCRSRRRPPTDGAGTVGPISDDVSFGEASCERGPLGHVSRRVARFAKTSRATRYGMARPTRHEKPRPAESVHCHPNAAAPPTSSSEAAPGSAA